MFKMKEDEPGQRSPLLNAALGGLRALWAVVRGAPRNTRSAAEQEADHRVRRRLAFVRFQDRCLLTAMFLAFFVFPAMSKIVSDFFACRPVGDTYYLIVDMREQCYTKRWRRYRAVAFLYVALYPLGIPLAFFAMLWYFGVSRLAKWRRQTAALQLLLTSVWQEARAPCTPALCRAVPPTPWVVARLSRAAAPLSPRCRRRRTRTFRRSRRRASSA